jgi:mannose-6-phosphate isomerase-like protein (cupin superfamily)
MAYLATAAITPRAEAMKRAFRAMRPAVGRREAGPTLEVTGTAPEANTPAGQLDRKTLARIATGLASTAAAWADRMPVDLTERTGLRIIATDRFDVWLLRWPFGTYVTPHDHGHSAGAFYVVEGKLQEVRWHGGLTQARTISTGRAVTIGQGVVHDVIGAAPASLSVHVYSPPLSSMSLYETSTMHPVDVVEVAGTFAKPATDEAPPERRCG